MMELTYSHLQNERYLSWSISFGIIERRGCGLLISHRLSWCWKIENQNEVCGWVGAKSKFINFILVQILMFVENFLPYARLKVSSAIPSNWGIAWICSGASYMPLIMLESYVKPTHTWMGSAYMMIQFACNVKIVQNWFCFLLS